MLKKKTLISSVAGGVLFIIGVYESLYLHRINGVAFVAIGAAIIRAGLQNRITESNEWERDDIMALGLFAPGLTYVFIDPKNKIEGLLIFSLYALSYCTMIGWICDPYFLTDSNTKTEFLVWTLSSLSFLALMIWSALNMHTRCENLNLPFTGSPFEIHTTNVRKKIKILFLAVSIILVSIFLTAYFLIER